MDDEYSKKLNDYIGLGDPKSSKSWIKVDIFLVLAFFLFITSNSLLQHFDLLTSWWMVFVPFAFLLVVWGVFLLLTINKRQIDFLLYHGTVGLYLSVEFFTLGFSYGTGLTNYPVWFLILLIALDIPFLLWIIWYRMRLFKRIAIKEPKKQYINPFQGLLFSLVLLFTPIIKNSTSKLSDNITYKIGTVVVIMLGYAMSMLFVYICNYVVSRKYINYIDLYGEDGKKLSTKKKVPQRIKPPKQ